MFELVDEIYHVLAHRRPVDAVHEPAAFEPSVLGLDFLDHLFPERAHFSTTRYRHVFIALVPEIKLLSILIKHLRSFHSS